jgi:hypothetical protein
MKLRDYMPSRDDEKLREKTRRNRLRVRYRVLSHYSGGTPSCACCGESTFQFLALDHQNGGGGKERKSLGLRSATELYRFLENNGYPPGYRVLCHNCNLSLGFYGYCRHIEVKYDDEWLAERLAIRQHQPHAKNATHN